MAQKIHLAGPRTELATEMYLTCIYVKCMQILYIQIVHYGPCTRRSGMTDYEKSSKV